MRITNIIYGIYGIAIAAAHAVGTNSGSGQHNNDTLVKHNLNNNLEDACDGSDCSITDNRIGHQAMHNHTGQIHNRTGQMYNHTGQTHYQNDQASTYLVTENPATASTTSPFPWVHHSGTLEFKQIDDRTFAKSQRRRPHSLPIRAYGLTIPSTQTER